jgi:hypothetical protein
MQASLPQPGSIPKPAAAVLLSCLRAAFPGADFFACFFQAVGSSDIDIEATFLASAVSKTA